MESIPARLLGALSILGLSKYDARIYAALVLFDRAEAKELVEFLGISKPSVYEGLEHLQEIGLAVKLNSKPARFGAVSPDIAVKMLMDTHQRAAEDALADLRHLESRRVETEASDAVWTTYGERNIEYKVQDMIAHAKNRVDCLMADRYLPLVEPLKGRKIAVRLVVLSDEPALLDRLLENFSRESAEVHVISPQRLTLPTQKIPPQLADAAQHFRYENILELIVDDAEMLTIPPVDCRRLSGLNTSNRAMILHAKAVSQYFWNRMIQRGDSGVAPANLPAEGGGGGRLNTRGRDESRE
ncbi:MAG TPA: helix-turn-helix domain-containing protein [Methanomicrobiales archaeon]|nr:helix-turn-helix domain-containing protein [Methanomicrobiales archaeon]